MKDAAMTNGVIKNITWQLTLVGMMCSASDVSLWNVKVHTFEVDAALYITPPFPHYPFVPFSE